MVTTLFETLDKNKEDLLNAKYITNESEREERITIQKSKIELLEDLINYTETPFKRCSL